MERATDTGARRLTAPEKVDWLQRLASLEVSGLEPGRAPAAMRTHRDPGGQLNGRPSSANLLDGRTTYDLGCREAPVPSRRRVRVVNQRADLRQSVPVWGSSVEDNQEVRKAIDA